MEPHHKRNHRKIGSRTKSEEGNTHHIETTSHKSEEYSHSTRTWDHPIQFISFLFLFPYPHHQYIYISISIPKTNSHSHLALRLFFFFFFQKQSRPLPPVYSTSDETNDLILFPPLKKRNKNESLLRDILMQREAISKEPNDHYSTLKF